jgi:hypothetical protein
VLAALGGTDNGAAIRDAIRRLQRAQGELQRLREVRAAGPCEPPSEDSRRALCRISLVSRWKGWFRSECRNATSIEPDSVAP